MATSYIAIGSNLGNRRLYINKAIKLLKDLKEITVEKVSSIYETDPVGGPPNQNKFLNGVIEIKTSLNPFSLLKNLKRIEKKLTRKKTIKNGPRTIDLDILTYGDKVIARPNLLVPHPRLDKRDFVLKGFCEIAHDFIHPIFKKSIKEIYGKNQKEKIKKKK